MDEPATARISISQHSDDMRALAVPRISGVEAMAELRRMLLAAVVSPQTRRNYAKAIDEIFSLATERGVPLSRSLFMEYRAALIGRALSPSTINVHLSALRKLVHEARKNGVLGAAEAAELADIPNVREQGTRLGNWLTREQARELLTVPDRESIRGKRDYAILAVLVGCALRRAELAALTVEDLQQRENRWVIADLHGKGGRIRTVAVPHWVKKGIDAWTEAASIYRGALFRSVRRGGHVSTKALSDWAVWSVVQSSAEQIGVERLGAHDLRRTCAKLCRKAGGDLEQIRFLLGHASIQTTERYLGSEQEIAVAVNDNLGL
jgi:integrase